jgi:hypothetical protein
MKLTKKQKLINKRERHKKSKAYLTKQARIELKRKDKDWSIEIRKDNCLICGTTEKLNAHHLVPRNELITRHLYLNGISLCAFHHKYCNKFSSHRNPAMFLLILRQKKPEQYTWLIQTLLSLQFKYNINGRNNGISKV